MTSIEARKKLALKTTTFYKLVSEWEQNHLKLAET
jgi:hypothetical protein